MIIALTTQKGGTGKTTLATSLAVAAVEAGETVAVFDLDPQGSLAAWGEQREAETPHVETFPVEKIKQMGAMLDQLSSKFSTIILDTAGADTVVSRAAMMASDLCLLPLRPTRIDLLAIKPTVQAVLRLDKRFAFVLNQCPTMPKNNRAFEVKDGLSAIGDLALPLIGQRVDYQDAYAGGEGVTELAPDGKAAEEMRELWKWVVAHTNKAKRGKAA